MSEQKPLTLKELYERVKGEIENNPRSADCKVCIPNNKGGMGGTSVTYATSAHCGIDWDVSKFFIHPATKMIEAGQEPVKDWREQATKWAHSRMPKGWDVNKATPDEVHSFYVWMLMFIRDCYSIYQKHI